MVRQCIKKGYEINEKNELGKPQGGGLTVYQIHKSAKNCVKLEMLIVPCPLFAKKPLNYHMKIYIKYKLTLKVK